MSGSTAAAAVASTCQLSLQPTGNPAHSDNCQWQGDMLQSCTPACTPLLPCPATAHSAPRLRPPSLSCNAAHCSYQLGELLGASTFPPCSPNVAQRHADHQEILIPFLDCSYQLEELLAASLSS